MSLCAEPTEPRFAAGPDVGYSLLSFVDSWLCEDNVDYVAAGLRTRLGRRVRRILRLDKDAAYSVPPWVAAFQVPLSSIGVYGESSVGCTYHLSP